MHEHWDVTSKLLDVGTVLEQFSQKTQKQLVFAISPDAALGCWWDVVNLVSKALDVDGMLFNYALNL